MPDGSVIFDTKLDTTGVIRDLSGLATGALKAAAAGLAALGTYAISAGSDFEAAMSNVAATMGVTVDEIGAVSDKAKELGATTAFSASQAAEGFNILAQSGLTMEEQLASIDSVLGLASAGEMQMADAAGYLTTTVKAFSSSAREANISMEDTARLADLYAKGATLANTSTAQFGDAMTSAASVAGAYNQSIDTTGTLLLALAEKGYQGSVAGTYLSRAMSDLYAPTANAQKALEELGVSAYDSSGQQRDMIEIIGDLQRAFEGMTDEEISAYTATIFTTAGLKAFNSIAGSSQEELEALRGNLTDCTGAAEQMAATKLDNLQGDITILKSATEGFGIAIYENMQEPLRAFVQEGTGILDDLHQAIEQGGLAGLAGGVGKALSRAVNMIAQYAPKLATAAVDLVRSFVGSMTEAAPELANVAVEIGTTLLSGIMEISADLIALGSELIIALCTGIAENIDQITEALLEGLELLSTTIIEYLPLLVEAGLQLLTAVIEGIIEALPQLIETAGTLVTSLVNALVELVPKIIECGVTLLTALVKGLPQIINTIVPQLPLIINSIINGLLSMLPQIIQCGIQLLVALIAALPEIITTIVGALPEIILSIVDTLTSNIPAIVDCGIQIFTALIQAMPEIISTIVQALPEIITSIIDTLMGFIPDMVDAGWNLITGLGSGISQAVGGIIDTIVDAANDILGSIKRFFGIASPSKVFRDVIGKNLMLGLARGIDEEADAAVDSAMDAADELSKVSFKVQEPQIDDGIDYDALAEKASSAVSAARATTSREIGSSAAAAYGPDNEPGSVSDDKDGDRNKYILNVINVDGKTAARVLTPYVAEELEWEDNG